MKLTLRGDKSLVAQARRAKAELRLGLMLGRFGDEVEGVTLHLSKTDGVDGHPVKRCRIAVAMRPKRVRVESTDEDLAVALERAADKAVRSIARILDRERRESGIRPARST
jgi:ribosome-associated translation inhibitor RaiA